MKATLLAVCLLLSAVGLSKPAVADSSAIMSNSVLLEKVVHQRDFDYIVFSKCMGCISFGNYSAVPSFPVVNGGFATGARMYYDTGSFFRVTLESPYIELRISRDHYGEYFLADAQLGNLQSGRKLFFKVALVDDRGQILYYPVNGESDPVNHAVVVR